MKESEKILAEMKPLFERHKCQSYEFIVTRVDKGCSTEEMDVFIHRQLAEVDELRKRYEDALMKEYES